MKLHVPRRGRRAAILVSVAVVAAAGITAYAASGASASYRTAKVALGDVTQVLDLTGTVSPSGRSDLQFGTAGTVSTALTVGTVVHKGDVVASLDTTQLRRSLVIAQASVAQALSQVSADQTALNASATTAPIAPSHTQANAADAALAAAQKACVGGSGTRGSSGGRPGGAGPGASASVTPSASASSTASVAPARPSSSGATPSGTPSNAAAGMPSGAPSATVSSSVNTAACAAALQKVSQAVRRLGSSSAATAGGTTGGSSAARTSQAHVTQATVSRDEATLAQARTKVIQAQQELTGAVITAPADGTVAETDVAAGSAASAGTTAVTVIGAGLTTVRINATVAQVAKLAIDQAATVSSTLGAKVATGKVTWIGQLPGGSSTSTFPVVVTLAGGGKTLEAGAPVDVAISLGSANGVITVPTSAVRDGSVSVLEGGSTTSTGVTVGLVGPDRTQITSGLTPGQTVVLANLNAALPTSTVNQGRFGGGLGGFGGGLGGTRRTFGG